MRPARPDKTDTASPVRKVRILDDPAQPKKLKRRPDLAHPESDWEVYDPDGTSKSEAVSVSSASAQSATGEENKFATASLTLGIIGIPLFLLFMYFQFIVHSGFFGQTWLPIILFILGVIGFIFGTLGISRSKRIKRGRRAATIGRALSIIYILPSAILFIVFVFLFLVFNLSPS